MKEEIRKKVLDFGAQVCGFASVDHLIEAPAGFHPRDIYPNCRSIIAFGVALPLGVYLSDARLIYSYFNDFTCSETDRIAFRTAAWLERAYRGIGMPLPSDEPYEVWNEEKLEGRGLISMKHAAFHAGLGSLGKNTLLMNQKYGNRLVIGCVLTDLEIEPDERAQSVCIENCDRCLRNCPAESIRDGKVDQSRCRNNSYGKTNKGFETVECNRCRTVCPVRNGVET